MVAPHRGALLSRKMDEEAARYTSSASFDKEIYEATLYVNAAHIIALEKLGAIKKADAEKAINLLSSLKQNPTQIPENVEDIHIYLESLISQQLPETGEMLAYAKSRNDAVVAAVKIEGKKRIYLLTLSLLETVEKMIRRSVDEAETVFPVYTHLQRAAPASFGFVLQSYAVRLLRCGSMLLHILEPYEECPLGSAAVAGTSVPIDRKFVAELLGFREPSLNALEATASRDFLISTIAALLQTGVVLSCLAEEIVLYSSEEFGLISVAEELAATSSIMPQKRNPVVAEIMRTKFGELLGLLTSLATVLSRQPSGYNLDLQQTTPKLWQAFDEVMNSVRMLSKLVDSLKVNKEKALQACAPPTAAVELANALTQQHRIGFRTAHQIAAKISKQIAEKTFTQENVAKIFEEHGLPATYSVDEILSLMDPVKVLHRYAVEGSTHPEKVKQTAEKLLNKTMAEKRKVEAELGRFLESLRKLLG